MIWNINGAMMSAIEMRKLMEAVQLNENLVKPGNTALDLMGLNVFGDLVDGEIDDAPQLQTEKILNDPDFKKMKKMAKLLASRVEQSDQILTSEQAEKANNLFWYDGNDSYENEEEYLIMVKKLYPQQIAFTAAVLTGNPLPEFQYWMQ